MKTGELPLYAPKTIRENVNGCFCPVSFLVLSIKNNTISNKRTIPMKMNEDSPIKKYLSFINNIYCTSFIYRDICKTAF